MLMYGYIEMSSYSIWILIKGKYTIHLVIGNNIRLVEKQSMYRYF